MPNINDAVVELHSRLTCKLVGQSFCALSIFEYPNYKTLMLIRFAGEPRANPQEIPRVPGLDFENHCYKTLPGKRSLGLLPPLF